MYTRRIVKECEKHFHFNENGLKILIVKLYADCMNATGFSGVINHTPNDTKKKNNRHTAYKIPSNKINDMIALVQFMNEIDNIIFNYKTSQNAKCKALAIHLPFNEMKILCAQNRNRFLAQ